MKRWNHMALALCLAAATAACAGDQTPDADRPAGAEPVGTAGRDGNAAATRDADADREFVEEMIADSNAEVELGRLVRDKSKNRQVREFAAMMIEDHRKAGMELKQAASTADITTTPSAGAAEDHNELEERLSKLSGAEFDREYIQAMIDDHQEAVDAAQEKADGAANAQVKQWAANTLPTLRKHLDQAKRIQENLENK